MEEKQKNNKSIFDDIVQELLFKIRKEIMPF